MDLPDRDCNREVTDLLEKWTDQNLAAPSES
jgi:hypothetical protein